MVLEASSGRAGPGLDRAPQRVAALEHKERLMAAISDPHTTGGDGLR
jgi:hypothetical protein